MAHASEFYDQMKAAKLTYREVPVTIRYSAESLSKGQSGLDAVTILFDYVAGKFIP